MLPTFHCFLYFFGRAKFSLTTINHAPLFSLLLMLIKFASTTKSVCFHYFSYTCWTQIHVIIRVVFLVGLLHRSSHTFSWFFTHSLVASSFLIWIVHVHFYDYPNFWIVCNMRGSNATVLSAWCMFFTSINGYVLCSYIDDILLYIFVSHICYYGSELLIQPMLNILLGSDARVFFMYH